MKRFLTAIILLFTLIPTANAAFTDLHELHQNYFAISTLKNEGVLDGYQDGSFKPDIPVNRAEFLALALKGSNVPLDIYEDAPFKDVDSQSWYNPVIQKAYAEGWINGYNDQTFRPEAPINKAEAIKVIGAVQAWELNNSGAKTWYDPFVSYARNNNLLPQSIEPHTQMSRADTSEVIYRSRAIANGEIIEGQNLGSVEHHPAFTAQAPFGEWSDIRQSEGCEEAAVYMAIKWAKGESFTLEEAKQEIITMSHFQTNKYGTAHDTSGRDTFDWLVRDFYQYQNAEYRENITLRDILDELHAGNLIVVPVNAKKLPNPSFTYPGPLQHTILIKGYDSHTQEFITHDPGTRQGGNFRYHADDLNAALYDYESGDKNYLPGIQNKNMIIVRPL